MSKAKDKDREKIEELTQSIAKVLTESEVNDYVEENYLPFAWSVCLDRALVYSQDGLKPIQRRILYTAYKEGLSDKSPKMKSATFSGRVMKYSPHGDCYGSIVNIASSEKAGQPRPIRVPLVKGKGNWGGIDSPAASCFIGDTMISLADGTEDSIKSIYNRIKNGEKLYVYSVDTNGDICIKEITNAFDNGVREIIEVELDNGEKIYCTPEHRFMVRSGEYKQAQLLEPGESLMPLYRSVDNRGYEEVYQNNICEYTHTHHLMQDVNLGFEHKKGYCFHHLDCNKKNNNPDNLYCVPFDLHAAIHSAYISGIEDVSKRNDIVAKAKKRVKSVSATEVEKCFKYIFSWFDNQDCEVKYFVTHSTINSKEARAKAIKNGHVSYSHDWHVEHDKRVGKSLYEKYGSEYFKRMSAKGGLKKYRENNPEKALEISRKNILVAMEYANKPHVKMRGRLRNAYGKVIDKFGEFSEENFNKMCESGEIYCLSYGIIFNHYNSVEELKEDYESRYNHKVTAVRFINKEERIYDIEVKDTHNFALSAGVFVHNSRYTEMSLWPAAMELLKELNEDTVDMVPNYDNTTIEPVYLPARFPVALINGVPDAMAVGYACNIPSHNPDEVMDACIALLNNEDISIKELSKIINGPDFDCGCDIIAVTERDGKMVNGISSYMETGSGSFIMKAVCEQTENNGSYTLNFKKLPYKISPERVIEEIKKQYEKGELKELSSWKDLSDIENPVNLEIITKKNINISKVLNDLYKMTSLQCVFAANNTIIIGNSPTKADIKTILSEFISFRKNCTKRKLNHRLEERNHKLHIQEAIKAVLVDIDKCISIIRNSDDEDIARDKLKKTFKLDDEQANYILSLQLRKLTKSDIHQVNSSIKDLSAEIKEISGILNNEKKFISFITSEMEDTKKVISSNRKCHIVKQLNEEVEIKQVYLSCEDRKITRSFNKTDDSFEINEEGKVLVVTKDKCFIRSIYEIPDNKPVLNSKLKFSGTGLTVAASEGYLLIVGLEGSMKIVDMSTFNFPRKDVIDSIFKQEIVYATQLKELDGAILVKGSKRDRKVSISDIPVQSMSAKSGKRIYNGVVESIELIK